MGYTLDFRKKVMEIKESEKLSVKETAKRFGIGTDTVVRWKKNITPCKNRNKPSTKINMEALKKDVEENPDYYLLERAEKFKVSGSAIFYALRRLNIRCKKKLKSSKSMSRKKSYLQNQTKKI